MPRKGKMSEGEESIVLTKEKEVKITPPNFQTAEFTLTGVTPYVMNKFSQKVIGEMAAKHAAGSTANKGTKRKKKDFDANYQEAMHRSKQGWIGIPASCFRNALISACRLVGFKMTIAKLTLFVEADGYDRDEGTPLIKITHGEPTKNIGYVRNADLSPDIRIRPLWEEGWQAKVRVRFDADQFTLEEVSNLFHRVGLQVGIGEGRPDSKKSAGMGWGLFSILRNESKPVRLPAKLIIGPE